MPGRPQGATCPPTAHPSRELTSRRSSPGQVPGIKATPRPPDCLPPLEAWWAQSTCQRSSAQLARWPHALGHRLVVGVPARGVWTPNAAPGPRPLHQDPGPLGSPRPCCPPRQRPRLPSARGHLSLCCPLPLAGLEGQSAWVGQGDLKNERSPTQGSKRALLATGAHRRGWEGPGGSEDARTWTLPTERDVLLHALPQPSLSLLVSCTPPSPLGAM